MECVVCLESFPINSGVICLECAVRWCSDCHTKITKNSFACPQCRTSTMPATLGKKATNSHAISVTASSPPTPTSIPIRDSHTRHDDSDNSESFVRRRLESLHVKPEPTTQKPKWITIWSSRDKGGVSFFYEDYEEIKSQEETPNHFRILSKLRDRVEQDGRFERWWRHVQATYVDAPQEPPLDRAPRKTSVAKTVVTH
jgi:hypothetical protein